MKVINNIISPLPFYDSLQQQNHNKDYAFGQIYPLISHRSSILPFQAVLTGGTSVVSVTLHSMNGGTGVNITGSMGLAGLKLTAYEGFSILKFDGAFPIPELRAEGPYYLEADIEGLGSIYSDVFVSKNDVSDCLMLEYSNPYNFKFKGGEVDFSEGFKFRCYLPTQVGRPEYEFEEEATTRMGYTFIESQVSKKVYHFTFVAPEYLCDALRIVRLCSNKRIVSKGRVYELINFNMKPEWQEQGDLAGVDCEFETDNIIANIGGYEPVKTGGDFNDDFDTDYLKEETINQ